MYGLIEKTMLTLAVSQAYPLCKDEGKEKKYSLRHITRTTCAKPCDYTLLAPPLEGLGRSEFYPQDIDYSKENHQFPRHIAYGGVLRVSGLVGEAANTADGGRLLLEPIHLRGVLRPRVHQRRSRAERLTCCPDRIDALWLAAALHLCVVRHHPHRCKRQCIRISLSVQRQCNPSAAQRKKNSFLHRNSRN